MKRQYEIGSYHHILLLIWWVGANNILDRYFIGYDTAIENVGTFDIKKHGG